jgi:predicted O-linked N-acetylglucosamine transferase (SPINDLY family)
MPSAQVEQLFNTAIQRHRGGQLAEAAGLYRQVIAAEPRHAEALHLLGVILRRQGNSAAAIDLIRRALAIDPACENAWFNLGNALREAGQLDQAIEAFKSAIAHRQNVHQAYHNLALVLKTQGRIEESAAALGKAEALRTAIDAFNLGNQFGRQGRFAQAAAAYQQAISIHPQFAEAHCNLGNALLEAGQLEPAIAAYRQAIALDPNVPEAHHNLAKAHYDLGQLDESIAGNQRAMALRPGYTGAIRNLANSFFEAGRLDEALATCRSVEEKPELHSDLIYKMHFHPSVSRQAIDEELARWNQRYAQPLAGLIQPHANDRSPDRRLRIGYVSPDFRQHVVGMNLLPLFSRHDHSAFEIFCYAQVARPDAQTRWFEQHADVWRDCARLSDEQLADQIRADRIDVLVDLALHTPENRLLCFARKPAPVQVSFAGYPGRTGVSAIAYRLSDPYLDPSDSDKGGGTILHLPASFWCHDPGVDVPVNDLPTTTNGYFTFGCLNNFCKINPAVLDLWASVMRQVEHSRLILLAKQGGHRQAAMEHLEQLGIAADRIEFVSYLPRREYLSQYHRIDIGLDTFPYNGHTTSLDSLWMGVPMVTLVGKTAVARAGWSQLSNLGLTELAADSREQFVTIATKLAGDTAALATLRASLRRRMEQSPLMDSASFAVGIENAYRQMWQRWCAASQSK